MATLTNHVTSVLGVAFSPDGRLLATATSEEVRLWNVSSLWDAPGAGAISELLVLPGGPGMAFTPQIRNQLPVRAALAAAAAACR